MMMTFLGFAPRSVTPSLTYGRSGGHDVLEVGAVGDGDPRLRQALGRHADDARGVDPGEAAGERRRPGRVDAPEVRGHRDLVARAAPGAPARPRSGVESSPLKYWSTMPAARITRVRASLSALARASSYWRQASAPATQTKSTPASSAPSSTRRRNGRVLASAVSRAGARAERRERLGLHASGAGPRSWCSRCRPGT